MCKSISLSDLDQTFLMFNPQTSDKSFTRKALALCLVRVSQLVHERDNKKFDEALEYVFDFCLSDFI